MKKLLLLLLVAGAAWYGWKHYPELLDRRAGHDAVIQNRSGRTMERVRLSVDGQTFVKESLADENDTTFPFKVANDATFHLEWQFQGEAGDKFFNGGMVPKGPMLQRHVFTVDNDGAVLYRAENKAG